MNKYRVRIIFTVIFFILLNLNFTQGQTINKFEPVSYDLKLKIDYKDKKLSGKCTLTFKNEGNLDTLPILLYRILNVKSVTDINGNPLNFSQRVVSFSDYELLQVNNITIYTANIRTVVIDYEGYLLGYTETGMSYVKDNINPEFTVIRPDCFSYPLISNPTFSSLRSGIAYKFDYFVEISVPDSLFAVNGGKLVSSETIDRQTTFKYINIKPAWRIDVCIGKYNVLSDMDITVYYFAEDSIGASSVLSQAVKSYKIYSDWFGELNTTGYSIIEIPDEWGSQADVTCIIQSAAAFKDIDKIEEAYHELSHLWNVSPTDSSPCRVESEGLATFIQYLVKEKLTGNAGITDTAADRYLSNLKRNFLKNNSLMNIAMIDFGKNNLTDYSYTKGMLFFYLLHNISGDEAFFGYFKKYYRSFRETGGKTDDLMNIIIMDSKNNKIKILVNDWIYTAKSSEIIINSKDIKALIDYYKNIK